MSAAVGDRVRLGSAGPACAAHAPGRAERPPGLKLLHGEVGAPRALVAFPHAGASGDVFRAWRDAIGARASLWAVDYPGRRSGSGATWAPCAGLEDLADRLARELAALFRGCAVTLFGHSLGAILAYEVAVRLEAGLTAPSRLVVSAAPSPRSRASQPTPDDPVARAESVLRHSGTNPVLLADPGFHELTLRILMSDLAALDAHVPSDVCLGVPLRVLASFDDRVCPVAATTPWREYSTSFERFAYFPGSHLFPYEKCEHVVEACLS